MILYDTNTEVEQSVNLVKETADELVKWIINKSGSILIALIFILIGMKIVGLIIKLIKRGFEKSKLDSSVAGFLLSVFRVIGYILVFITAATMVGIQVTSFVAIIGTASMAIGLALQGALSNLAGGVLILILKPFTVGDYIIENDKGTEGTVSSIDIFYTRLITVDNRLVVIPNGVLTNNSLINVTKQKKRKIEVTIPIAYDTDIKLLKEVVAGVLESEEKIMSDEPTDIFISSFDDSGMTIAVRAWAATTDYWPALWSLRESLKQAFDENEIRIPYSRVEVDMKS